MNPRISLMCAALLVVAAGNDVAAAPSAEPECRVDVRYADQRVGNAGCLVVRDGRLLVVRHAESGKLTFPAGYAEGNESAQCTAHRETWEEAGVQVQVGQLLKVFPNDFHLYSCDLEGFDVPTSGALKVPVSAAGEIREVLWIDAIALTEEDWRFPQFFPDVKTILASYRPRLK